MGRRLVRKCQCDSIHQQIIKRELIKAPPILLTYVSLPFFFFFFPFQNNKVRRFAFELKMQDKSSYLLAADSEVEMEEWITILNKILQLNFEAAMQERRNGDSHEGRQTQLSPGTGTLCECPLFLTEGVASGQTFCIRNDRSDRCELFTDSLSKKGFCHIAIYYPDIIFIRKSCDWKNHSFGSRKEDLSLNPSNIYNFSAVRPWASCLRIPSVALLTCEMGINSGICWLMGRLNKIMYVQYLAQSQHLKYQLQLLLLSLIILFGTSKTKLGWAEKPLIKLMGEIYFLDNSYVQFFLLLLLFFRQVILNLSMS